MTEATAERPAPDLSPWAPLRNKVFLALFIAQLVSNLGTLMQTMGSAWLMGDLGASSAQVAMVQTATFLPVFLVGIAAGALADLFDRRRLLIWTQASMLLSAAAMAVLAFTDSLSPLGVLALTFVLGTGSALMIPAWQALQPDLVGKEHLAQAVSLGSLTFNLGRSIGPAIGGVIIAASGAEWVFLINAVSFVGTIGVLVAWRPASTDRAGTAPTETFTGAAVAGLRYAVHSPLLHTVLARSAMFMLPASAVTALLPIVVRGQLDWTSGGYGALLACFGVGAMVGAVMRPRIARRLHPDAMMAVGAAVMAGTLLVQGYVHSKPLVGAALAAGGCIWSLVTTANTVSAQAALPAWVRARGLSLFMMAQTGSIAVGASLWGVVANWNVGAAHLIAAVALVIVPVAAVRWPLTLDREFDLTLIPGADPEVALTPSEADGPVLVSIPYRVPPEALDEFRSIMEYLERHRRRTGGYQWYLFRDLSEPDRFVENFLVSSWAEHLRQHHRNTAAADVWLRRARRFVEQPGVRHLLSSTSEGAMAPHIGQLDLAGPDAAEVAELERALEREHRLDPAAGENL
jgi:MFS family permease